MLIFIFICFFNFLMVGVIPKLELWGNSYRDLHNPVFTYFHPWGHTWLDKGTSCVRELPLNKRESMIKYVGIEF